MKSLFPDICSDALAESKSFYVSLFGFVPVFEIDWYIQLRAPNDENVQIAFVARNHASVPQAFQCSPQGVVVTIEATDAAALYEEAGRQNRKIVLDLRDEAWGQRHFMTVDPNGLLVDVVQTIPPSPEFLKENGLSA